MIHAWCEYEATSAKNSLKKYKPFLTNCRSVNEVICHGIPDGRPLKDGDIVNSKNPSVTYCYIVILLTNKFTLMNIPFAH